MSRRTGKTTGGERGLTLVEVLVALLVLSFVALGVISLLGIAIKQNKLALERSVATGLASGRMSQVMTMPYRPLEDFEDYQLPGEAPDDGPPAALIAGFGDIPGYPDFRRVVSFEYDTPVVGMLRVRVDVVWWSLAQAQEKTHTMVTYVHPALEKVN